MIDPNAPAYAHGDPTHGGSSGFTKREEIAKAAMEGILAGPDRFISIESACERLGVKKEEYKPDIHWPAYIAMEARAYADALISALNEKTKDTP